MSLKIMPLGDSITHGVIYSGTDTESGGYRTELWNLFGADNFSADMVGSISSGPSNIDRNHEGHRGWRIDEISSSVDGWLTTYQPDAIMLMIGTNDILQNYDVPNAGNRLDALVDKITSKVPNARLFLGSIPPSFKYADDLAQVATFNTQVLQIANNKVSQGKKVTFVDINSKLNENDLADKIHPTIDGYTKIGNAWYDALLPFTDIKKTTRIQAEDMTLTNYSVESGNSSALARKVISLVNTPNATGIASFNFSGTSGKYDVVLGYYDENDGQAQLKVKIGGNQVDQWTLNQNLGSGSVNSQTKTRRTVATSFTLNQGTTIEIQGTANQTEYGRVDYVELIPNETSSTANLSAANITEGNGTTHTFSVTYRDDDGVNLSTLDGNDIRVTGTNNFNQLAYLIGVNQSGGDVTGFYRINAPGGSWDTADNGTYSVALQNGEVKDTQNNSFPSGNLGTFQVNVPPPLANIRIEAENMQRTTYVVESNSAASNGQLISLAQSGGSIGTATTTFNGASGIYDVVVRYFDENDGQTTVTAKIGGTTIAQWTFNQNLGSSGANSQTAVTKTIATSLSINQGTTIQLQGLANQGEYARVDYIEFLAVGAAAPPADVTAPTASLSAANITQGNGTTQTFTVTYTDDKGVDVSSLDGDDLRVTGPNSFDQMATLVSVDTNTNGTPRTATYSINAPGGTWDTLDNGSYTVALQTTQVKDTSSNFVGSGNLGTFQVNVPQPATNIRMEAENMQLTSYLVESNSVGSGSKVIGLPQTKGSNGTATTTFTGASGTYDVLLRYFDENDGQAMLTTSIGGIQVDGRTLNQNLGSGAVDSKTGVIKTIATGLSINQGTTIQIQGVANQAEYARVDYIEFVPVVTPPPPADITAPTASLSAANITQENGTTQTFTVTYTDDKSVDVSSLDGDDLRVTGPNSFDQMATLLSVDTNTNGTPRTATYSINAPGGTWDMLDNGSYTVALQENQVKDTSSNFVGSGNLGTFQVNINTIYAIESLSQMILNSKNKINNGLGGDDPLIGSAGNNTFNGSGGADLFVLAAGQGSDFITDFADGQDRLGLSGGLTFEQLAITQGTGENLYNTVISIANSDRILATLTGIQASNITAEDFTTV